MLITACVFLRFVCPAILSPNLFGLCQEYPQEKAARKLTLVAKTLQTIANFSKFGAKESYMSFEKMNLFVEENTSLMRDFIRNISTLDDDDGEDTKQVQVKKDPNNNGEIQFELELIDIGKQLATLHGLLGTIWTEHGEKLDAEIGEILTEISEAIEQQHQQNQDRERDNKNQEEDEDDEDETEEVETGEKAKKRSRKRSLLVR